MRLMMLRYMFLCTILLLLLFQSRECGAFTSVSLPQRISLLPIYPRPKCDAASARHTPSRQQQQHQQQRQQQQQQKHQSSKTTTLLAVDPLAVVAVASAISGGLFSGALHAIAGPDHLAALLPRCCGQRWYRAGRVGALWGMGHGASATLLGVVAFAVKKTVLSGGSVLLGGVVGGVRMQRLLSSASQLMEVAVGLSLVLIGVMGIREAREWSGDDEDAPTRQRSLSAAAVDVTSDDDVVRTKDESRAVVLNGVLHGFSWDGAPSLAPALALATWSGNLAFLMSYAIGTMAAMAIVTTLVGEGTRRAGQVFQRPDIPQKLSLASSVVAIVIGVVWCGLGLR